jgi:hypothetical protein
MYKINILIFKIIPNGMIFYIFNVEKVIWHEKISSFLYSFNRKINKTRLLYAFI